MKVKKVINNNFVIVEEENEMIVLGKGIRFKSKIGDRLNSDEIDKVFFSTELDSYHRFKELLENVSPDVVEVTINIETYIKTEIGKKVNAGATLIRSGR